MANTTCKDCSAILKVGENWLEGQVRNRSYLCRTCVAARSRAHYALHSERAAELQRKRLSEPSKARAASELKSKYYAANRDKWESYRITQKSKESSDPWRRASRLLTWIRARAAKMGHEFDLTREWVGQRIEAGVCEVTGIPLELGKPPGSRFHPWAPSVDRIDSKLGYTQSNCRVVCWIYNMAKSEWSDEVVMTFAKALSARSHLAN